MTTALTMFNEAGRPAHLNTIFQESNIESRVTVPSLSYQGKVWTISLNGEKTKLQRKNADGDLEPVTTMKVIILDYAKRRGRTYYEGSYNPDKESAPICWSDDGITPSDSLPGPFPPGDPRIQPETPRKIHAKCDGCPMAIKGSKVTDSGKQVTACSQHRMLAVVPAFNLGNFPALRLKIAITSDFDKQSPKAAAENWFAFSNYMEFLLQRGVKHSAELITKIKFDNDAAYPKLFFSPDRWLETDEAQAVLPLVKDPDTAKLLGGTWTPAGVDGVRTDETTAVEAPATEAQAASQAAATADEDDDDGEIVLEGLTAPAPEAKQEPAQAAVTPTVTEPKPDPQPAAKKAETVAPAASTDVPDDIKALLAEWE